LVLEDHYGEDNNNPYQLFNLTDSGTVTDLGVEWQPKMSTESPEFTINGFNGTVTIANARLTSGAAGTDYGYWAISNPGNSNVFLPDDFTRDANFALGITFGSTVSLIQTFQQVSGTFSPVADNNSMGTAQMATQFAQVRSNAPSQDTALPPNVSDVQMSRIQLDALTTGIDIEPGT
jgi:hypothetical protein